MFQKLANVSNPEGGEVNSISSPQDCNVDVLSGPDALGMDWADVGVGAISSTLPRSACQRDSIDLQRTFESPGVSSFTLSSFVLSSHLSCRTED